MNVLSHFQHIYHVSNDVFEVLSILSHMKTRSALSQVVRARRSDAGSLQPRDSIGTAVASPAGLSYQWVTNVSIGTPPQYVPLELDTGSGVFWVYDPANSQTSLPVYDPSKSSTFRNTTPDGIDTWEIAYASTLENGAARQGGGYICEDDVQLGTFLLPSAPVGIPTYFSSQEFAIAGSSGIMGLSPPPLPGQVAAGSPPPFITTIAANLDEQVFTANLKQTGDGAFEFGTIDQTQYTGDITWIPVNTAKAASWLLEDVTFSINGTPTASSSGATASCMVDTGGGGLSFDSDIVNTYYSQIPNAQADAQDGGVWEVPCDAQMPSLGLNFGNSISQGAAFFEIPGEYILGGQTIDSEGHLG
ncbi:hypothetical protein P7C71_g4882, partial [Lecanoromycetidae sp. Uapishka_2]